MRLSDLQNKDVVSISDGNLLGNIIDVEISDSGNILKLIVYNNKGFIKAFRNKDEMYIKWSEIKKIGSDVILIDKNI